MPKQVEKSLKAFAKKKYKSKKAQDRYVYGTMRKMGWRPAKKNKR